MDHQYGIAVTNKFSLFLDEDEDPLDVLSRQEEQAKTKKKDDGDKKPSKSKQKKNVALEPKTKVIEQPVAKKEEKAAPPKQNEKVRGGTSRDREPREIRDNEGDKRPPRRQGPKENREAKVGDENVPPEFRERPEGGFRRREDRGDKESFGGERARGRGRGRGRGGPRGDRGGFGGPRGNFGGERKREFDRHSGTDKTGIKSIEKREGSGAHNWGNFKDDIEEQVTPSESNEWTNQPEPSAENPELNESAEVVPAPEEEAQPHEMTLDEWKALQTQNKPKAEFNIRQAGEGEDGSKWSKGREYHKKHEEEDDEDDESDDEDEEDRHSRGKHLVTDIRITFNDTPRRGRGRRGGRGGTERGSIGGGGRGSRGALRGVGGKPRESAPRFDDEADFPSLVKLAA